MTDDYDIKPGGGWLDDVDNRDKWLLLGGFLLWLPIAFFVWGILGFPAFMIAGDWFANPPRIFYPTVPMMVLYAVSAVTCALALASWTNKKLRQGLFFTLAAVVSTSILLLIAFNS